MIISCKSLGVTLVHHCRSETPFQTLTRSGLGINSIYPNFKLLVVSEVLGKGSKFISKYSHCTHIGEQLALTSALAYVG